MYNVVTIFRGRRDIQETHEDRNKLYKHTAKTYEEIAAVGALQLPVVSSS